MIWMIFKLIDSIFSAGVGTIVKYYLTKKSNSKTPILQLSCHTIRFEIHTGTKKLAAYTYLYRITYMNISIQTILKFLKLMIFK